jgi:hypothetical protein
MQGVKEAIILLKQYGTPVFTSAVAGAKFSAWAGIIGGGLGALFLLIALLWFRGKVKKAKGTELQLKDDTVIMCHVITGMMIIMGIVFMINGFYELVSIDYQAYKMMLLK